MSSIQQEILRKYFAELCKAIGEPGDIASTLYGLELISDETRDKAGNEKVDRNVRARNLLSAVQLAVDANPDRLVTFLQVLKGYPSGDGVVAKMENYAREKSQIYASLSGEGGSLSGDIGAVTIKQKSTKDSKTTRTKMVDQENQHIKFTTTNLNTILLCMCVAIGGCLIFLLLPNFSVKELCSTYIMQTTQEVFKDCMDVKQKNQPSGVYVIKPDSLLPLCVYCDMDTDGGGWIVFQRRMNGSVDFYRDWADYEYGFGDQHGEHWLGLRNIHRLTASAPHKLRVDLQATENESASAKYDTFSVSGASDKYRLHVSRYTGDAGDSLSGHSGMQFTTRDQDNDQNNDVNCAITYWGAWWYGNCRKSNLNGNYYNERSHSKYADGINWKDWKGYHFSMQATEMKIRRKE